MKRKTLAEAVGDQKRKKKKNGMNKHPTRSGWKREDNGRRKGRGVGARRKRRRRRNKKIKEGKSRRETADTRCLVAWPC